MVKKLCTVLAWSTVIGLAAIARNGTAAEGANPSATLAPFVNNDTFAVACIDIGGLDQSKNRADILNPQTLSVLTQLPSDAKSRFLAVAMAEGLAIRLRDAGVQNVYLVIGLGDVHSGGGPIAIAMPQPGKHPEEIEKELNAIVREIADDLKQKAVQPIFQQVKVTRHDDAVFAGMKDTVSRYEHLKPAARNELLEPLDRQAGEGAVAAAVFCPGSDFRRVIRELWPALPGSLAPLRGELADRWLSLELAVNRPPAMNPRLALNTRDSESAQLFATLWQNMPQAVTEFGGNDSSTIQARGLAQILVGLLPTKVEGNRVAINISTGDNNPAELRGLFGTLLEKSMESANTRERVDRMKQICLGLLNFDSANRHLPPAAIRDKDGKPLLSWRVAILPYIEEYELYKRFHLDEPWDSPHNKALIDKMPDVYAGLGPGSDPLNREGKTTYEVPVGPETAFYKNEGTQLKEIADGTSHTILVVDVEPAHAVVWTKPEDWEVDLKQPKKGLESPTSSRVTAGFADGHVEVLDLKKIDDAKLRSLFTRAGHDGDALY